jgi:phage terminase large subunit
VTLSTRRLVSSLSAGPQPETLVDLGLQQVVLALARATGIRFPDPYWWDHPIEFWERILGCKPWSRQAELLEAVRRYKRVACKSGRRVSKSKSAAGIALNFYGAFEDARVIMTSTTARQVDAILWRELLMTRSSSGRCIECKAAMAAGAHVDRPCPHSAIIEGDAGQLARTGLRMQPLVPDDFREIFGFTASEGEAVQGIAGKNMLFIVDEASGVPQPIYDAIEGNRAGGGVYVVLLGNPTKVTGEFYDAFNEKALDPADPQSTGYFGLTISSTESPNITVAPGTIPGLADPEWLAEREREWGKGSAMWIVHIEGNFATNEEGRVFPLEMIRLAEERWSEDATPAGRLVIGVDPAGEGGKGDESAMTPRRGMHAYPTFTDRGCTDEKHRDHLLALCKQYRVGREIPAVIIDRDGVGSKLYGYLSGWLETLEEQGEPLPFEVFGVRGSDKPEREAARYDRQRDALAGNLVQWFRDGGAIPEDPKLTKELHAFSWIELINKKLKVTPKDELRKELGRSPDRYDSLVLAVWEPSAMRSEGEEEPPAPTALPPTVQRVQSDDDDGLDVYEPSGGIDPYE